MSNCSKRKMSILYGPQAKFFNFEMSLFQKYFFLERQLKKMINNLDKTGHRFKGTFRKSYIVLKWHVGSLSSILVYKGRSTFFVKKFIIKIFKLNLPVARIVFKIEQSVIINNDYNFFSGEIKHDLERSRSELIIRNGGKTVLKQL